jgi:tRNA threonylcarbamoyl adenosine modification protein YeaZ
MNILGFDTCLDKMYVVLAKDDAVLDSKIIETTKEHYHSAFLISTIKGILKDNHLTPQEVDVIATNIGPGSFTGIRACTTVARVFAQASDAKVVGISSLGILSRLNDSEGKTIVALDARKDMAYIASYENKKEILAPQLMLIEDLKELIINWGQFVVCDDKLAPIFNTLTPEGGISYQQSDKDLGKFLVQIAYEKLQQDCETDWHKLHPLYIQPPPVNVKCKE